MNAAKNFMKMFVGYFWRKSLVWLDGGQWRFLGAAVNTVRHYLLLTPLRHGLLFKVSFVNQLFRLLPRSCPFLLVGFHVPMVFNNVFQRQSTVDQ